MFLLFPPETGGKSFEILVILGNNFSHVHRFSSKNSKISTSVLSKGKYYFDPENDDIFLSLVGKSMTLCFLHSLFIHKILIIKYVWYMKICNLTIERKNLLFRLTVTYTEVVYPARILPNQTAKPVAETQKLAECIYDCRTLLQQILTDGLTVLQNSKPAPSYQQHKAGLSKQ